jgi:hypothetical protein
MNILSAAQILCLFEDLEYSLTAFGEPFILHYWGAMFVGHKKSFLNGFQALA